VRQRIQGELPTAPQPATLKAKWGVTRLVKGDPHLRTDSLGVDATAGAPSGPPTSLLYLAQLTDLHVIDEESPGRTVTLDGMLPDSWRAQEAHSHLVADAMVRKLRELSSVRALDFVLITGDCIDNNQKNELDWFLKLMEGGPVLANSGVVEDPIPGPDNDPHDLLQAMGLGIIPWYVVMGNHDGLVQGNLASVPVIGEAVTGDPTRGHIEPLDTGRVNTPTCKPIPPDESPLPPRCVPVWPKDLQPGDFPGDPQRVHLSKSEWLARVASAGGLPVGHGLKNALASSGEGDYVVDPVPGLPLRLIVLNTCASLGALGSFDDSKLEGFLAPALKQAEADEVAVFVVSHHGSDGISSTGSKLRQALNGSPNVLLHLIGHGHVNLVTPRPGATPLLSYWEVQTSSLIDWPQQARLLELVDRRDGTAELWLTLVDYETSHSPAGPIAAGSRFFALREVHSGDLAGGAEAEGKPGDRNVILPVALTPKLRQKLAALPGQPVESALFG